MAIGRNTTNDNSVGRSNFPNQPQANNVNSRAQRSAVQMYYDAKQYVANNKKDFEDAAKAAELYTEALKGIEKQLQTLDKTQGLGKLKRDLGGIQVKTEDILKRLKDHEFIQQEEMASFLEEFFALQQKLTIEQTVKFGEVVKTAASESEQAAAERIRQFARNLRLSQGDNPMEKSLDKLQQDINTWKSIQIANNTRQLVGSMWQQGGGLGRNDRNALVQQWGSRNDAYDVLSNFAKQNMKLNDTLGVAVFSQKQSVALIKQLNASGMRSTHWMEREYEGLVKLQELVGEGNVLTQTIVDNTYALRGGSSQVEGYLTSIMNQAKVMGVQLNEGQVAGQLSQAIGVSEQIAREEGVARGYSGQQLQNYVQQQLESSMATFSQSILNGTFNQVMAKANQMVGADVNTFLSNNTSALIGGYNINNGIELSSTITAGQNGYNSIMSGITDNLARRQVGLGQGDFSTYFNMQSESEKTALNAADTGAYQWDKNARLGSDRVQSWRESLSNNMTNWFSQSSNLLKVTDFLDVWKTNASDTAGAILNGMTDAVMTLKTINDAVGTLQKTVAIGNVTNAASNLASGKNLVSIAKNLGKVAVPLLSVAAIATSVAGLYSMVKTSYEESAQLMQQAKSAGMSQADLARTQQLTTEAANEETGWTLGSAVAGGSAALATMAALSAANIWHPGGWVMAGITAIAALAAGVAGNQIGKSKAEGKRNEAQGAVNSYNIRNATGYQGTAGSAYGDGGGDYSYNSLSLGGIGALNSHASINGYPITAGYGQDKSTMGRNTGGGWFEGVWIDSAQGWTITSGWPRYNGGQTPPKYSGPGGGQHAGMDLGVGVGTEIGSASSGKVIYAYGGGGYNSGWGNTVVIQDDAGYKFRYGHFSSTLVSTGDTVKPGDLIGKSGNTGYSTGPHLHFEVRPPNDDGPGKRGTINPYPFFNSSVTTIGDRSGARLNNSGSSGSPYSGGSSGPSGASSVSSLASMVANKQSVNASSLDTQLTKSQYINARFNSGRIAVSDKSTGGGYDSYLSRDYTSYGIQPVQQLKGTSSTDDVIKSMNLNFKSLEGVIKKVSALEMQYSDLKDSIRAKETPALSFSN